MPAAKKCAGNQCPVEGTTKSCVEVAPFIRTRALSSCKYPWVAFFKTFPTCFTAWQDAMVSTMYKVYMVQKRRDPVVSMFCIHSGEWLSQGLSMLKQLTGRKTRLPIPAMLTNRNFFPVFCCSLRKLIPDIIMAMVTITTLLMTRIRIASLFSHCSTMYRMANMVDLRY